MREIRTEIGIAAPPARVWEILADFSSYGEWNPFIPSIKGAMSVGSKLEVRLDPPGGRAMTFRPKVLVAEPNREFRWLGRLGLPKVFDGEHIFTLEPLGDATTFIQREEFGGVLVPMLGGTLAKTEEGFRAMNEALKERAEARAG